jgi:hypothetical protein
MGCDGDRSITSTSPYHPQSNGKIERWHQTIETDAIRRVPPASLEDARKIVAAFVAHYNNRRLHSAIGFITPADTLRGRREEVWAEREFADEAGADPLPCVVRSYVDQPMTCSTHTDGSSAISSLDISFLLRVSREAWRRPRQFPKNCTVYHRAT